MTNAKVTLFQGDKVRLKYGPEGTIRFFEGNVAVVDLDDGSVERIHKNDLTKI